MAYSPMTNSPMMKKVPKLPHFMYKGKSKIKATTVAQHNKLEAQGYTHKAPRKTKK